MNAMQENPAYTAGVKKAQDKAAATEAMTRKRFDDFVDYHRWQDRDAALEARLRAERRIAKYGS